MTTKKPRKSRTPKLSSTGPKLSKKVLLNITSLSIYNSDKPLNQHMITLVQHMYKTRDITNFKTATTALDLLTSKNDFNKFKTTLTKITKVIDKKPEKAHIKRSIKQDKTEVILSKLVQQTEKVAFKPQVTFINNAKQKFQKNDTIMPSYEIIIKRKYQEFYKVWNECITLLYRHARHYMEQQQKPLKVRVGVEFTIFKVK
jgi:hypothetical protein